MRPKATRPPPLGSASPGATAPAESGSRLSYPGPVARVPAAALPVEGRRSACLAAGNTRHPRTRARAKSGRRNTSPGSCPPARSQHTPLHRFCYPSASTPRPVKHTSRAARTGPRLNEDDRRPRTVGCRTALVAAPGGQSSADDGSFCVTGAAPATTGLMACPCPAAACQRRLECATKCCGVEWR